MVEKIMSNLWEPNIIPYSDRERPRGKTVYWITRDNEENFRKNPKPGYTETSITYTYNSHGFRTKEFDFSNGKGNILFLGCSHTEGIGLRAEDTWVHKVSQHFPDHNCYNLGIGGGGVDMVTRFLYNLSGLMRPEVVFILWPSIVRFETYEFCGLADPCDQMESPIMHGPWDMIKETMFLYSDYHSVQSYMKNRAIVDLLKKVYNFKLVEAEDNDLDILFSAGHPFPDEARDDHFPPSLHTALANEFMRRYNNDNSTV